MRICGFLLLVLFGAFSYGYAQDTIIIDNSRESLNTSIANCFTLYESSDEMSGDYFLSQGKRKLSGSKLQHSTENLNFTASNFFIHFVLLNQTSTTQDLAFETGRPITNLITLQNISTGKKHLTGDALEFSSKSIATNRSIIGIMLPPKSANEFLLTLASDGEVISLPIIFWEKNRFEKQDRMEQFSSGIFYGIYFFVIIIYLTFYIILKDNLFLIYTAYVFMAGLLQFALDGYLHQYVLTSGGYATQHAVIVIAGLTVFFVLLYATHYLDLSGKLKKASIVFASVVLLTVSLSLIPGKIYELCYPLINGFSLIAIVYLLIIALRIRRKNANISRLFVLGMFALLVGAIIFILGNFSIIDAPYITQRSLKAGGLIEIICLSILMAGRYKSIQEEKEIMQLRLLEQMKEKHKIVSESNIRLEQEVRERTKKIEDQRILLKQKNDDMVSSITYAEKIQSALLSNVEKFKAFLPNSFVFFRPKDIVSGDFFWIEKIEPSKKWPQGLIVYATADCTGHGVPGAFVSIICNNLLKLGKAHKEIQSVGQVLDYVNTEINQTLNSKYGNTQIRDGMDVALCAIDIHNMKLYFSGAKNGVYIIRKGALIEVKGDRKGIGYSYGENKKFTTQSIPLEKNDVLYTFSDGIVDQFGGPKQKKLTSKRLKELLLSLEKESIEVQHDKIEQAFDTWKGDVDQIDDVLLIGVRIS